MRELKISRPSIIALTTHQTFVNFMKKYCLIIIIIGVNLISCQEKEFSSLEDKKIVEYFDDQEYFDSQYENEETSDYFSFYKCIYETVTNKNSKLKSKTDINSINLPWKYGIKKPQAYQILENISDSLYAQKDGYSNNQEKITENIQIISQNVLELSISELDEYKSSGSFETRDNILDHIKFENLEYNLKNENGDIVKIEEEYTWLCGQGFYEKEGKYYHGVQICNKSLNPKYKKLFGYIELDVNIPVEYEVKKVTKQDIGKTISIGANKIKILEFDANAIHYQLIEKKETFEIKLNGGSSTSIKLPFDYYKKLRLKQGLDFETVVELKNYFELDNERKNYEKEVVVIKVDDYAINNFYFYISKFISKKIKVDININ